MEVSEIIQNICMLNEKLSATLIENCQLRRDILLLEEELRAFKTQAMIHDKLDEEKNEPLVLSFKSGTKFAYKVVPQPNKVYTDEEPIVRKKYNWHR